MKRLITLVGIAGLLGAASAPALAHTSLSKSNIVAGSEIYSVPDALELTYAKPVGLAAVKLDGPDGSSLDLKTHKAMHKRHTMALPDLAPGAYRLTWRAVASDGHIMTGEIAFTVVAD